MSALVAILAFAGALLAIFGALYWEALRSYTRGEMGKDGIRVLRWALLGYLVLYALLAVTAFLT